MGVDFQAAQDLLADTLWDQTGNCYRQTSHDVTAYQAVQELQNVKGRRRPTSNFDTAKGFAGQSNQDNLDTSDTWKFGGSPDSRAGDVWEIDGQWFVVAGDAKKPRLLPRQVCFITTTTKPRIIPGHWTGD